MGWECCQDGEDRKSIDISEDKNLFENVRSEEWLGA
jgi:hypothetical protein